MASLYRFGKPIRAYSQKLSTFEGQACLRPLFFHVGFVRMKTLSNVSSDDVMSKLTGVKSPCCIDVKSDAVFDVSIFSFVKG